MARRGKTIDYKEWASVPGSSATLSTNTTTVLGSLAFAAPGTILRCRGFISALFNNTVQVGDILRLTFGLGIVSTDAVAAVAVPDPDAEPEFPWLWWGQIFLDSQAAPEAWGIGAQRYEVDTKAMRRFKPGTSLVWVMESTDAAGAPATNVRIGRTRVLIGT